MAGLITLQTIFDQSRAILGNRNATDIPNATMLPWTNWALDQLSSPHVYRHPELWDLTSQTLVAATRLYTIDTAQAAVDTVAVLSAVIVSSTDATQRIRLRPIRMRDGFAAAGRVTAGTPLEYSLYSATQLELYPTPSSGYSAWNLLIRRIKVATQFTVAGIATEKSPLHRFFDEALVMGTVWRGWRHLKETLRAEGAKTEYAQCINEVTDRLTLEAEDRDFGPEVYVEESMP